MPSEILTKYIEGLEYNLPVPKKLGYFFRGWYKEQECINRVRKIDLISNEDLNLYPLWVKKTRKNAYVSFLGDSITTYEGIIPEGFPTYYPAGDVDSIDKTWWNIALKASMTNLLANNSYSGSYVSQGTMYGASEKRIELLSKDGIDPDVVVINMGTNDLTHNISLTKFTTMYKQMIENIKKMYDDVDIFVLNMPFNKYAMSFNEPREKMNESIKAIAEEYGLFYIDLVGLIDFNGAYEYMYAGAHPNAAGMEIIGKEVGKLLSREYKRYWLGEE
jgi:lysophospholipase L1-like esterase